MRWLLVLLLSIQPSDSAELHRRLVNVHLEALGIFQPLDSSVDPRGCDANPTTSEELQEAVAVGGVVCVAPGLEITSPIKIRRSVTLTGGPVTARDVRIGFDLFHLEGSHQIEFVEFAFGQIETDPEVSDVVWWIRGDAGAEPDVLVLEAVTIDHEDREGIAVYAGFDVWGRLDGTLRDFDFRVEAESDRNTSFVSFAECANWLVEGGRFHGTRSPVHLEGGSPSLCLGEASRNGAGIVRGVIFERSGPEFDNAAGFVWLSSGDGTGTVRCETAPGRWEFSGNVFQRGSATRVSRAFQGSLGCETGDHPGELVLDGNISEGPLVEMWQAPGSPIRLSIDATDRVTAPGYPR